MKNYFLTALTIFTLSSLNAQDVTFGAKAGLNFSNADITDANMDSKTSIHLGVTAEFKISETLSIQPELLYSAQGAKESDSEQDGDFLSSAETTYKLNYILLPVMAKLYVAEGLSLEAGPQIGFLTSAELEVDSTYKDLIDNSSETVSVTTDIKEAFKSIDFGLNFGLGYKLDSGLNFGVRYNLGLSNIVDEGSDDYEIKNRVFQLSVGYTF